jgi:hypothetical protein
VAQPARGNKGAEGDSKTLTIRSDVDFPNVPLNVQLIEPWSEIYVETDREPPPLSISRISALPGSRGETR